MEYYEAIKLNTTPVRKQDEKEYETPFGKVLVHDWRSPDGPDLGRVVFKSPVINNVDYRDIDVYLTRREHVMGEPVTYWRFNQFEKITDSARLKIERWLDDNSERFAALRSPLTSEDESSMHKAHVRSRLLSALTRLTNEGFTDWDIDEALEDAMKKSKAGIGYRKQWMND